MILSLPLLLAQRIIITILTNNARFTLMEYIFLFNNEELAKLLSQPTQL